MEYSITQAAEKMNLTAHTLRYYEKEGLLPFVERTESGIRIFTDSDLEWLSLICCLKGTGMSIKKIKEYIDLCLEGDRTLEDRRQIFIKQRESVLQQIQEMQKHLAKVNYKIQFYDQACAVYQNKMDHFKKPIKQSV
nr:MerR family transcriptional regulator [uncultured Caproiciproducens sp.]